MKAILCLIVCLFPFWGSVTIYPAMALDDPSEPLVSLTAKDEPLGDVLDTLARETGYQFNLNRKWKDHPVSATINRLPLEQGLKRLLRSLNHSIIWEADKTVTIMVFGKADPLRPGSAVSFGSAPQAVPEDPEPPAEMEEPTAEASGTADTGDETPDNQAASQGEDIPDQGDAASGQAADRPEASPDEVSETASPEAGQLTNPAEAEK